MTQETPQEGSEILSLASKKWADEISLARTRKRIAITSFIAGARWMAEYKAGNVIEDDYKPVSPIAIMAKVCKFQEVDLELVISKDRHKRLVEARHICIYFIRQLTPLSLKETGELFGVDHSSAIHAIQSVKDRCDTEPMFKKMIETIGRIL